LGLIGIIALIIIYIIKPNYQNKFISSTFIWKLSLKYKKKKIPLNTLRNIILFLCQVAIITGAAFILAQPFLDSDEATTSPDVVLVIDASASMHAHIPDEDQTRLERAADAALEEAKKAFADGNRVTVILASESSSFLVQEAGSDQAAKVYDTIESIKSSPEEYYTYGTPDIEGAMKLAEEITSYNEKAAVTLFTDTTYLGTGKVKVHNVVQTEEWNAAILDVRATMVDGFYRIEIDVASYGKESQLSVVCEILNANGEGKAMEVIGDVYCSNDKVTTLIFGQVTEDMSEAEADMVNEVISVTRFDELYVHIDELDSLSYDNQFYLYGGKKPVIKIKYYSSLPNNFWVTALEVLADSLRDEWDIKIDSSPELMTEGFDIYVFEHTAPKTIPNDGIVIYSNPASLPAECGIRFGQELSANGELFLSAMDSHDVMKNVDATSISVTKFISVASYDNYTPLFGFEDYPMALIKDDIDQKIVVLPFSLHYSNLSVIPAFPILIRNIINYYCPQTVENHVYEPGDTVTLDARSHMLSVLGPELDLTLEELPSDIVVTYPGTYTMTQYLMSGNPSIDYIYVKIPSIESNVNHTEENLVNPYFFEKSEENYTDLLFYFALAVVALLFFEWWLKSREQI